LDYYLRVLVDKICTVTPIAIISKIILTKNILTAIIEIDIVIHSRKLDKSSAFNTFKNSSCTFDRVGVLDLTIQNERVS